MNKEVGRDLETFRDENCLAVQGRDYKQEAGLRGHFFNDNDMRGPRLGHQHNVMPARPSSAVYRVQIAQRRICARPSPKKSLGGWEAAMDHSVAKEGGIRISALASRDQHIAGDMGVLGWDEGALNGDKMLQGSTLISVLEEEKRKNLRLNSMLQAHEKTVMLKEMQNRKLLAANEQLKDALHDTYKMRPWSAAAAGRRVSAGPWPSGPPQSGARGLSASSRRISACPAQYDNKLGQSGGISGPSAPAFGKASLEHRAVYSPYPDEPSGARSARACNPLY